MKEMPDHLKLDNLHYQELLSYSPKFKKYHNMAKSNLIDTIARKLYFKHGGTIREHGKMIAIKKLNNIDLAFWLYQLSQ